MRKHATLRHVGVFVAVACLGLGSALAMTATQTADRIEEDWELVIATPSPDEAGPQVTTTLSPLADNSRLFFAFNVNYRANPFRTGGLQVEAYDAGKSPVQQDSQRFGQCQTSNETVTWTQSLSVSGGSISFDILCGTSTTWGTFGQGENLSASLPSSVSSLEGYSPEYSVKNSGVTWQANRVSRMVLKAVRYYANGQLLSTDSTPRSVNLDTSL